MLSKKISQELSRQEREQQDRYWSTNEKNSTPFFFFPTRFNEQAHLNEPLIKTMQKSLNDEAPASSTAEKVKDE